MAILTAQAIEGFRQHTERSIARAQYRAGNTWHDVPIHRRERLSDGRVAVYFSITTTAGATITVAEVQLLDANNNVWARNPANIIIRRLQEGILYRFAFDFREVS